MKKKDIKVVKDLQRLKGIYFDRQALVQGRINQFESGIDKVQQEIVVQKEYISQLESNLYEFKKSFYHKKSFILQEVKQHELEIKQFLKQLENEQYNLESLNNNYFDLCEKLQQERDVLKSLVRKEEKFSLSIHLLKNNNN